MLDVGSGIRSKPYRQIGPSYRTDQQSMARERRSRHSATTFRKRHRGTYLHPVIPFVAAATLIGIILILNSNTCFVGPWYKLSPQQSCIVFWIGSAISYLAYAKTTQSTLSGHWGDAAWDAIIWCCGPFLLLKASYLWILQPTICLVVALLSASVGVYSWLCLRRTSSPVVVMSHMLKRSSAVVVAFATIMSLTIGFGLYSPMHGTIVALPDDERTLQSNIETAEFILDEDRWSNSDLQTRMDALQVLASAESRYLGVDEPRVEFALLGASTIADYVRENNVVRINVAFKDMGGREALTAIAHELAHCYEWACLVNPEHMKTIGIEFSPDQLSAMSYELKEHYSRTGKSYREQECERFARAYAQTSSADIEKRVEKWKQTGDASA